MASTSTYHCQECRQPFQARVADRDRGWARFCSKSCKAVKQTKTSKGNRYPRHDGLTPMKLKFCFCGSNAINGVHSITGRIEWLCEQHMAENSHPFSSDALGQWS